MNEGPKRYIAFSGGADSTAMALLLKSRGIDFSLLFSDTGAELPETIHTIGRVAQALKKPLVVTSNGSFLFHLVHYNFLLPGVRGRWCTRLLKLKPQDAFYGPGDTVYIGIRADEQHRAENMAKFKRHYTAEYPLIGAGMDKAAVLTLCRKHDLLNPLYDWPRSSVSCFCCPFQRMGDWRAMLRHRPEFYALAEQWEQLSSSLYVDRKSEGKRWTWTGRASLEEIRRAKESQLEFWEPDEEACAICQT